MLYYISNYRNYYYYENGVKSISRLNKKKIKNCEQKVLSALEYIKTKIQSDTTAECNIKLY